MMHVCRGSHSRSQNPSTPAPSVATFQPVLFPNYHRYIVTFEIVLRITLEDLPNVNVNVVALGLANLVGGLPTLIHNLFELRNETPSRYEELLGKKGRFWVHFTVASLCFVLLGASPPVIYGFSFRQSDDRELKMATVAGASLICVALLAVAKAHAQEGRKKPYLQMLLRYKLMEKLALFDDWAANLASPFSGGLEKGTSTAPSWGAY
ncbi:unnamed protein product [Spirodela intermedia]|uniref:Uncharacterized protein n=1 Tax=Spirodela intermedia TaxID=51605 RepID=A0A7I8IIC3_SPIIN|nr:unnamed protein product [Spirodela intermedia]CAA6657107.1 unnamed protein product [Spirodela intermedia]